jgi:hypothetical protein
MAHRNLTRMRFLTLTFETFARQQLAYLSRIWRQASPNERSACSTRGSKDYRSVSVPERSSAREQLELLERLEPLDKASLRCV